MIDSGVPYSEYFASGVVGCLSKFSGTFKTLVVDLDGSMISPLGHAWVIPGHLVDKSAAGRGTSRPCTPGVESSLVLVPAEAHASAYSSSMTVSRAPQSPIRHGRQKSPMAPERHNLQPDPLAVCLTFEMRVARAGVDPVRIHRKHECQPCCQPFPSLAENNTLHVTVALSPCCGRFEHPVTGDAPLYVQNSFVATKETSLNHRKTISHHVHCSR